MAGRDVVTCVVSAQDAARHHQPGHWTWLDKRKRPPARPPASGFDRATKRGIRMTTVTHEIDGKVGVVTLAKPPHNLIDDKLIEDLVPAYQAVIDGGCSRALLRSSQRHFCAGAELESFNTTTFIHTDQAKFEAMMRS